MKKRKSMWTVIVLIFGTALLAGCAGTPDPSVLTGSTPASSPEIEQQLVWVGRGTAYIFLEDEWVRTPISDYEFLVRQNRFAGYWESLKVQNRTHPEYDGSAGPADQQHFFRVEYGSPDTDGDLPITLRSTYGDGSGTSDAEYRRTVLEFEAASVSRFAPYNRYRITQHYRYEDGLLEETVLLFDRDADGTEKPFVRIDEKARMYTLK